MIVIHSFLYKVQYSHMISIVSYSIIVKLVKPANSPCPFIQSILRSFSSTCREARHPTLLTDPHTHLPNLQISPNTHCRECYGTRRLQGTRTSHMVRPVKNPTTAMYYRFYYPCCTVVLHRSASFCRRHRQTAALHRALDSSVPTCDWRSSPTERSYHHAVTLHRIHTTFKS